MVGTMKNPGLKKGIGSLGPDSFQWPKLDAEEKNSDFQEGKREGLLLSAYHLKGLISRARMPRLRFTFAVP